MLTPLITAAVVVALAGCTDDTATASTTIDSAPPAADTSAPQTGTLDPTTTPECVLADGYNICGDEYSTIVWIRGGPGIGSADGMIILYPDGSFTHGDDLLPPSDDTWEPQYGAAPGRWARSGEVLTLTFPDGTTAQATFSGAGGPGDDYSYSDPKTMTLRLDTGTLTFTELPIGND
ncbi:MAG: hypothetical protein FWD18_09460 [Micrococcales bacterium]|nr:hypothetical protein [Micrococcales bacterium]